MSGLAQRNKTNRQAAITIRISVHPRMKGALIRKRRLFERSAYSNDYGIVEITFNQ